MTPMIDVVFQLLIYFLVTFSTSDVLGYLEVSRPLSERSGKESSGDVIRLAVQRGGYTINDRKVSIAEMGALLSRLASVSTDQSVLVRCEDRSLHGNLIAVLDLCAEHELTKISVLSEGGL